MTAYNGTRYVRDAIDGILAQTFGDFEFIIVDDCSTDDTVAIVESYRDPRIRLIRNAANMGICHARNVGLHAAKGAYVAALDHDDISLPKRLELQVAFLDANPDAVLVATGARRLENGRTIEILTPSSDPHVLRWTLFTHNPLIHSSICMRLATLREHGLVYQPEFQFADDFELYNRLSRFGSLGGLPDLLTIYRKHGANASILHHEDMIERSCRAMRDVIRNFLGQSDADTVRLCRVLACVDSADDIEELRAAGDLLRRLMQVYVERVPLSTAAVREVRRDASRTWWKVVRRSAKASGPRLLEGYRHFPELIGERRSPLDVAKTVAYAYVGPRAMGVIGQLWNRD